MVQNVNKLRFLLLQNLPLLIIYVYICICKPTLNKLIIIIIIIMMIIIIIII